MGKRKPKCPKCKSKAIDLIEYSKNHYIVFNYDEETDKYPEKGIMEMGETYAVGGRCNECNHLWILKGVPTIASLDIEQTNELNGI